MTQMCERRTQIDARRRENGPLSLQVCARQHEYEGHPYLGMDLGKPRFGRLEILLEILDTSKIKAIFGKPRARSFSSSMSAPSAAAW